jgi:redox-sensitive bicupin YhaK (pirin superfamily)
MTAGHGVVHAEEGTRSYRGEFHGVQLWVAQPSSTRDGASAFEHHAELPQVDLGGGAGTVLVGGFGDVESPARRDTEHLGVELDLGRTTTVLPLRAEFEYGLVVFTGALAAGRAIIEPGNLAYLGEGRDELALSTTEPTRALLIGGRPFEEPVLMCGTLSRAQDEITAARNAWAAGDDRFGDVTSPLPRIEVGAPPWAKGN